jgi:TM2 domain-containing membrane protein YozV
MVQSSVYCESCLAASINKPPKAAVPPPIGGDKPDIAFVLGLIPGVGAIYNGEYFKAAIHVLVFGLLINLDLILFSVAFYFYMPFEAYYTAKKRKLAAQGLHIDTPIDRFREQINERVGEIKDKEMWGGIGLIALGALFLMNSFGVFSFIVVRNLWPVVLIVAGVILLLRSREKTSR